MFTHVYPCLSRCLNVRQALAYFLGRRSEINSVLISDITRTKGALNRLRFHFGVGQVSK